MRAIGAIGAIVLPLKAATGFAPVVRPTLVEDFKLGFTLTSRVLGSHGTVTSSNDIVSFGAHKTTYSAN